IRDLIVTGVQTCALPISLRLACRSVTGFANSREGGSGGDGAPHPDKVRVTKDANSAPERWRQMFIEPKYESNTVSGAPRDSHRLATRTVNRNYATSARTPSRNTLV